MTGKIKTLISLFMTLLIACLIKAVLPKPYINKEMENEFWIKKTHSKKKVNMVIGGDSRTYRGVSTKHLLASMQNINAVNLGYSDGGINSEYLEFLHERLTAKPELKVMLFGITPHTLLKKCSTNEHLKSIQSKTSSEIFSGMHYDQFLKYLPPYTPFELFDDSSNAYIIKYHQDGYAASDNYKGDFDYTYWVYWDTFSKEKVSDSLINVFIEDINKYQKEGIKIFAFEPPISEHMKEIERNHSGLAMPKFIERLQKNGVHWIHLDHSAFKSYDGSHIFHEDAERMSTYLGQEIKKVIDQ